MSISFNPQLTTSPVGQFQTSTQGYYQGDFVDDPAIRLQMAAGQIVANAAQPYWGGMALTELVSTVGENALGTTVELAATAAAITSFSVFTQNYAAIVAPGNNVPLLAGGQTINFFRVGSRARIKVAVLASEAAALEGGAINQALYWDPALQQLTASGTAGAIELPSGIQLLSINANSKVVSYSSGAASWATGTVAVIRI